MTTTPTDCGFKSIHTDINGKTYAVEAKSRKECVTRCTAMIVKGAK